MRSNSEAERPADGAAAAGRFAILGILVLAALALKATSFGDPDRHVDETFYFLVGQRMHDGLLPYVDVWDRKPLGLFLIYYLIAGISTSVWAYQVVACLFAGATAFVIAAIVGRLTGGSGGIWAGLAYLAMLAPFEGNSGQAPDFYNLLVATAALLILREDEALRQGRLRLPVWGAMALCGLAITIKQTSLFESLFLGLWVLATLRRAGIAWRRLALTAALAGLIGALPTLSIAGFYWQAGHWAEFWHAMVLSNLAKGKVGGEGWRIVSIAVTAALLLAYALVGLVRGRIARRDRLFLAAWIGAAAAGFLAVPNAFGHYMLPLLVPLSVAAGLAFAAARMRLAPFAALLLYALIWQPPASPRDTRETATAMAEMAEAIRRHDGGGGLLVFDGPPNLYALSGERFLSPLVFPPHLNQQSEKDVSHLRTDAEVDRILARRPGVVVFARHPYTLPSNAYARGRALAYAHAHCRIVHRSMTIAKHRGNPIILFGDCR